MSTNPLRAIIWDLGGVLVRTEDPTPRTQLAKRLGLERSALETLVFAGESGARAQRGQISAQEHWQNLGHLFGLNQAELRQFRRDFWGGDVVDYDLVAFIRTLRPRYKTALLSNAFSDLRHYLTRVWRITDAFDALVISAEVKMMKPEAGIYRLVLEKLEVAPQQALFIDDSQPNLEGARAIGMHALLFQSPQQIRMEIQRFLDGGPS